MRTREALVDTAFRLFYVNGIHAVGINQVLQEAGVAKQTLYNHFESKDSLIAAAVESRDQTFFDWLTGRLQARLAGREALLEIFNALDDWFNDRVECLQAFHGCFFINTCGEYGDAQHPVHRQCAAHKQRIMQLIREHVAVMSKPAHDPQHLSDMLYFLKEGAIVKAHVEGDRQAALKARAVAEMLL